MTVGKAIENSAHLMLPVSFFIVIQVVEQGQCIREKSITQIAVTQVQPLLTSNSRITSILPISVSVPVARYPMSIIGTTISFAGNPRMNARRITPSSPKSLANGSRKSAQCANTLTPSMYMFAVSHISSPAGAATATARLSTNRVRSKIERIMTLPICGFLYGGNSSVNEEGTPFNIVFDRNLETANVIITAKAINTASRTDENIESSGAAMLPRKNIDIIDIMVGNRPLQGTKLFVTAAISRSRGESIIRHPVTPAALHPNPMHMLGCYLSAICL